MITLLLTLIYFVLLIVAIMIDFVLLIPVLFVIWAISVLCEAVSNRRKKLISVRRADDGKAD